MRCHSSFFVSIAVIGALLAPLSARAECYTQEPVPHVIDLGLRETDHVPPTLPPVGFNYLARGHRSPGAEGCGGGDPGCDAYGVAHVELAATDDVSPEYKIGYRFTVASGTLPTGLVLPEDPVDFPLGETAFNFQWNDGATDEQEPVAFTLRIVAVDQAGNESAPQMVAIHEDSPRLPDARYDDGNCRISNSRMPPRGVGFMTALVAMAIVRRRRVRRQRVGIENQLEAVVSSSS
jgi:hypothetical protein